MDSYVEQNCSITVTYKPDEVPAIVDWLHRNWDHYVGVSFLPYVNDASKGGYSYLPQEVCTKEEYDEYTGKLGEVDIEETQGHFELEDDECAQGVCPVK
jgi:ribonucleoside-triphosphate reductase (formate)